MSSKNYFWCLACKKAFTSDSDERTPSCTFCGSPDTWSWTVIYQIKPSLPVVPSIGERYRIGRQ